MIYQPPYPKSVSLPLVNNPMTASIGGQRASNPAEGESDFALT
jgi:hypothetical protein